jgi:hypothetical protein
MQYVAIYALFNGYAAEFGNYLCKTCMRAAIKMAV